jgi:hypothetical protein
MAKKSGQPGWDIATTTLVQLLGVGLFTILAGMNDELGLVLVIFMWGLIIGWMLLHTSELSTMVGNL